MLNDDVMDDMETTVVDHDLIKAPSAVASSQTVTVVPGKAAQQTTTSTAVTDIAKANVQFQVMDGKTNKIIEMQAVHDEIAAEGVICKTDVSYAAEHFPNMLSGRLSLNQFSEVKTKINHTQVLSSMKQSISTEQALLFEDAKAFFKDPLEAAIVGIKYILEEHLPVINNTANDLVINAKDISSKLVGSKHTVVQYKEEFKSFLEIPIRELKPEMFLGGNMDKEVFLKAIGNIETICESRAIKIYMAAVAYGSDRDNKLDPKDMRGEVIHDLTFKDLLAFYTSPKFPELIVNLKEALTEASTKIDFIKNSSNMDKATPAELYSFLVENNSKFVSEIHAATTLTSVVFNLGQLNFNTHVLFEEFKKA